MVRDLCLWSARKAETVLGGLFSRKDPRDAGPLLDIERALNKVCRVLVEC